MGSRMRVNVSGDLGVDSIVEFTLASNPDFDDLPELSSQIEKSALKFIELKGNGDDQTLKQYTLCLEEQGWMCRERYIMLYA